MDARKFVDSLFEGYEETAALADFKEELLGNLNAKIDNLVKKGMDADEAFAKASAELGDVSALADELSLKKRKEVFEEAYMDTKNYMSKGRVAAYVIFGVLAFFGIAAALITFFAARGIEIAAPIELTAFFSSMMPFLTTAVIGFTFLGVTQETASMYPVSAKRGAWYSVAVGLIAFGIFTMPIVFFGTKLAGNILSLTVEEFFDVKSPIWDFSKGTFDSVVPLISLTSLIIPFILPGVGLLVFLVLTEKDRLKPWAKNFHKKAMEQEMAMWQDPATATRFGMFSGAIWIFATGLFFLLGFLIGFKFSWLSFVFAVAFQLLIQGLMSKRSG
jgi:hypothetical protein